MKLLRVGEAFREIPAVIASDGTGYNASTVAEDDYAPSFWKSDGLNRLRSALDNHLLPRIELDGVRTGAPIVRPEKVVCIGLNYRDHAAESGVPVPAEPIVFFKAPNTVIGPNDGVLLPVGGMKVDWEVELGVVIGKRCRYLESRDAALQAVAGYCVSNDVSERAFQLERGGQWVKGKSCETFNPLGPYLVTPDEIADVSSLSMRLDVNDQRMQDGNTRDMVFSVSHIVWYLSQLMVLEPGDLINTGTPAGVGLGLNPPRYLQEGDVMELSIEGLGTQRQVTSRAIP